MRKLFPYLAMELSMTGCSTDAGVGGMLGEYGAGALGAYSATPEGKIVTAAFMDSYNEMVDSLRNYRAQTIQGGLGNDGTLGVQGGVTQ